MKLNIFILSLLAILPLSGCYQLGFGSIDLKPNPVKLPTSVSSERFLFSRDGKVGYIDKAGKIIIPARFDNAINFSEGLAAVEIDKKYGCIDVNGKIVIPPRFDYIDEFKNGLAEITLDRLEKGKIDKTGKIVTALSLPKPTPLSDNNRPSDMKPDVLTLVGKEDGKYGYEDGNKKMVIPAQFDYGADTFVEDMAWVQVKNRIGYINKQGKVIISPKFDYVSGGRTGNFDGGLARVCLNKKCGYIDKTGKIVVQLKFDNVAPKFRDGLAWVEVGDRLGYIDKSGKVVIPARYGVPRKIKGVIDGNVSLHKERFSAPSDFDRSLAPVIIPGRFGSWDDSYGYIDRSGKLIFKF
jgi:WG containing repeat